MNPALPGRNQRRRRCLPSLVCGEKQFSTKEPQEAPLPKNHRKLQENHNVFNEYSRQNADAIDQLNHWLIITMSSIPFRSLDNSGISVSALGLGCMGMSFLYGPTDDAENMRVVHRYLDLGGNFLDTAEVYGPYTNEELLGRFLKELPRESVVVATKFGFRLENGERTGIDSSPANVRRACDGSLCRLGIDR
jgi:hypothetical protein